jgi:hypothetical protein
VARKANLYSSVPGHPGIAVNVRLRRYRVRWTKKGKEQVAYFDSLEAAQLFRRDRGIGKSSPYNTEVGRRTLQNLRPGQNGRQPRVIHGGKARVSEYELTEKEQAVYEAIQADLPIKTDDGETPHPDRMVVRQLAEALIRRQRVTAYERANGLLADNGKVRPATELGLELDRRILDLARELGMTPRSRATLG